MAIWVPSSKYWWKLPIFKFFEFLLRGASGGSRLPLAQSCDTLKQLDHFILISYVYVWFKKEPLTRGSLEPPDAPRSLNSKNLKIGNFHQYFKLMTHVAMIPSSIWYFSLNWSMKICIICMQLSSLIEILIIPVWQKLSIFVLKRHQVIIVALKL